MKLVIFSFTLAFIYAAAAQNQNNNSTFEEDFDSRRFKPVISMAYSQVNTAYTRTEFEDRLQKYGCHCFIGKGTQPGRSRVAGGIGPTMDELDSNCWKLARCHKCINIEFGPNAIDVHFDRYAWEQDPNDGSLSCAKNDPGTPRRALCECDKQYAERTKLTWTDDNVHNEFFWKNNRHARQNPTFDRDAVCISNGPADYMADDCCGNDFPNLTPYATAQKSCCQGSGKVFNSVTHECCLDGSVRAVGSC